MEAFSYLTTFISLIPALAITYVLGGLADLVQHHVGRGTGRVRWSSIYLGWAVLLVLAIASEWWVLYGWHRHEAFNFWLFAFLLVKPCLLLFISRLFVPDLEPGADVDLEAHYFHVYRWTVPLYAAVMLLDIADTLLHGMDSYRRLGGLRYVAVIVGLALLFLTPLLTRRRAYHRAVVGLWLILIVGLQLFFNTATIR
jgi:hypothetical protein